MNTLQEHESAIISDKVRQSTGAGGTPAAALLSSKQRDITHLWKDAIDAMLGWKMDSTQFETEDRPNYAILDTALDYACDQMESDQCDPAPDSIIPSGDGRIAMEWNDGPFTVILEFVARGLAVLQKFKQGKLEETYPLHRNPRSRKLELQG
jgi:hypothetical protein